MHRNKVDSQPAYVLHTYPFRETSLIVEAFSRDFGRVALLARGARRPRSALRGLLLAFQPLELSWAGKGEVQTLMKAEWQGGQPLLTGRALFCGYYLNELLMHLLPREDAHERLFSVYARTLHSVAVSLQESDLRRFERALLQELGYGLSLEYDVEGVPIDPAGYYAYEIERGPVRLGRPGNSALAVGGKTLIDLGNEDFSDFRTLIEAKQLMRSLIAYYMGGKNLETRKIFGATGTMIELGVNIDHVATIRQARMTYEPEPAWAAVEAHLGGADGITVHLREDRRHIQDSDVEKLRTLTQIKLNLEMAATDEMVEIACRLKPEMAMLVPEGRHEVTTEGGLDIVSQEAKLKKAIARFSDAGIISSVFIDAELDQIEAAARIGARVCEIHTGPYAHAFHTKGRDAESPAVLAEIEKIRVAGEAIRGLGMRFNAGHALNYFNVQPIAKLPGIRELHIGHAIVSRAVFVGLREAVREMKRLMREAQTFAK